MFAHQLHQNPHVERTETLGFEIARLAAHIHAATFRFLVLIREFDELGGWADQGCVSCAHWLSWRCAISLHTGREKLRVAKALVSLPRVSEAFEQGRISYSKARAITRIADENNEEFLLGVALNGTAAHLDKLVRLENRRQKMTAIDEDPWQNRDIEWYEDDHGCVVFKVRLPQEEAARVIKAIETCRDQSFKDDVPAGTPDGKPTFAQRRADAFVALADDWLGAKRSGAANTDAYQVTLHVPAGTSTVPLGLEEERPVSIEAAQRICCDAGIVPISEDESGNVLDIGRKTRVIPPAMHRALRVRDKHACRFPGCTHTRYLHGHHIKHWAHGGATKLNNLVLLCSHHHHLVHEGGFGCDKHGNEIRFSQPGGSKLPHAVPLLALQDLRESAKALEEEQAHHSITKDTCLPNYFGDAMDYDMALQTLAQDSSETKE